MSEVSLYGVSACDGLEGVGTIFFFLEPIIVVEPIVW